MLMVPRTLFFPAYFYVFQKSTTLYYCFGFFESSYPDIFLTSLDFYSFMTFKLITFMFSCIATILMEDAAGGKSMGQVVNKMIADCAWGKIDHTMKSWTPCYEALTLTKPEELKSLPENSTMTYSLYLDECLYPREAATEHTSVEDRERIKNEYKKLRDVRAL